MTKDFLRKKLQIGEYDSRLGKEIEQSEDLGKSVSISPSYLFYDSRDTGCQYLKTSELIRIYGEVKIRRRSISYLIFESKGNHRIRIPGRVDFLRARAVCDTLCPHVLIGQEGREMNAEELVILYRRRKQALLAVALFLLCWSCICGFSMHAEKWLGITVVAANSIAGIILAVLLLRYLGRSQK